MLIEVGEGLRGARGQRLRVRSLSREEPGDLAARLGRRSYVNGVHRVSLLPVSYVAGVGVPLRVAQVRHVQDLAHGAQAGGVL